jgi:hypothetical protein
MQTYNAEEIEAMKKNIDEMDHMSMATLWRNAPAGHPYFRSDLPLYERFKKRFESMGGFTPEISKSVGWDQ